MNSYFAYHGPENVRVFDYIDGYGFKDNNKLKKVDIGDYLYVIQRIKGDKHFELCGKYKIQEKYLSSDHPSTRTHRLKLVDVTQLSEPLLIDEEQWSEQLPEHHSNYNWTNFKKHFCREGATLDAPLEKEVLSVFNRFLDESITSSSLIGDINKIHSDDDLSLSEKESMVKSRIGQGKFKRNVKKTWKSECCAVTLCKISELLIASHIKAWSDCETTDERLDGANGLLLCAHIDKLFDNHLITFKPKRGDYNLVLSKSLCPNDLNGLGIEAGCQLNLTYLTLDEMGRFKTYMDYHNTIFDKKNV